MEQILKHFRSVCVVQYKSTGFLTYLVRLSLFRNFWQRSYMLHTTAFQKISNHIQNYMQRFPLHILQSMYFCILHKDVFKFSDSSLWFWKSFLYFFFQIMRCYPYVYAHIFSPRFIKTLAISHFAKRITWSNIPTAPLISLITLIFCCWALSLCFYKKIRCGFWMTNLPFKEFL